MRAVRLRATESIRERIVFRLINESEAEICDLWQKLAKVASGIRSGRMSNAIDHNRSICCEMMNQIRLTKTRLVSGQYANTNSLACFFLTRSR